MPVNGNFSDKDRLADALNIQKYATGHYNEFACEAATPEVRTCVMNILNEEHQLQQELQEKEYEAKAGGGVVAATVNGKHDLIALTISPDVVDPDDAEMLADLVMAAINEANRNAAKDAEEKMGAVTGGMNIPGMF